MIPLFHSQIWSIWIINCMVILLVSYCITSFFISKEQRHHIPSLRSTGSYSLSLYLLYPANSRLIGSLLIFPLVHFWYHTRYQLGNNVKTHTALDNDFLIHIVATCRLNCGWSSNLVLLSRTKYHFLLFSLLYSALYYVSFIPHWAWHLMVKRLWQFQALHLHTRSH